MRRHFPAARSFLEIGCGTGRLLQAIAASGQWDRLVGAEASSKGLTHAARRLPATIELAQTDARAIPLRDAFDVVGAFDVIEHIAKDEEVLRQMALAVRPGGGVVVSVPQHPFLWSPADEAARHVRRYARGELERNMPAAGFEILDTLSYAALPLPLMALSRLRARWRPTFGVGVEAEWNTGPAVKRALRALLSVEVALTRSGLRFPAGGSRIVVGRKC